MENLFYFIGSVLAFCATIYVWKLWVLIERKTDPDFKINKDELSLIFVTSVIVALFSWFALIGVVLWGLILKNRDKIINFFNSEKRCIDIIKDEK